jgi:hypothetical protein
VTGWPLLSFLFGVVWLGGWWVSQSVCLSDQQQAGRATWMR